MPLTYWNRFRPAHYLVATSIIVAPISSSAGTPDAIAATNIQKHYRGYKIRKDRIGAKVVVEFPDHGSSRGRILSVDSKSNTIEVQFAEGSVKGIPAHQVHNIQPNTQKVSDDEADNKNLLVIIDMQTHFLSRLPQDASKILKANIFSRIERAKRKNQYILFVEFQKHTRDSDNYFGSTDPDLMQAVSNYPNLLIVKKEQDDGSQEISKALQEHPLDVDKMTICGLNTAFCVKSTTTGLSNILDKIRHFSVPAFSCADVTDDPEILHLIFGDSNRDYFGTKPFHTNGLRYMALLPRVSVQEFCFPGDEIIEKSLLANIRDYLNPRPINVIHEVAAYKALFRLAEKNGNRITLPYDESFSRLIHHSDPQVRSLMAKVLGILRPGNSKVKAALVPLLSDKDPKVVASAALAFGSFGSKEPEIHSILGSLLEHADPSIRSNATTALGIILRGSLVSLDPLKFEFDLEKDIQKKRQKLLNDEHADVRNAAAIALRIPFLFDDPDIFPLASLKEAHKIGSDIYKKEFGQSDYPSFSSLSEEERQHWLKGDIEYFSTLLQRGDEHLETVLNSKSPSGFTPIHRAIRSGKVNTVEWFLQHQHHHSAIEKAWAQTDSHGRNIAHMAVGFGNLEIVSRLLESKDPEVRSLFVQKDKYGRTPAHWIFDLAYPNRNLSNQILGQILEMIPSHSGDSDFIHALMERDQFEKSLRDYANEEGNAELLEKMDSLGITD